MIKTCLAFACIVCITLAGTSRLEAAVSSRCERVAEYWYESRHSVLPNDYLLRLPGERCSVMQMACGAQAILLIMSLRISTKDEPIHTEDQNSAMKDMACSPPVGNSAGSLVRARPGLLYSLISESELSVFPPSNEREFPLRHSQRVVEDIEIDLL